AVAGGEINSTRRQADIVEHVLDFVRRNHIANSAADFVKTLLGRFQTGAGGHTHVQPEFTGINRRKEIAPEKWHDAERDKDHHTHRNKDRAAPIKTATQKIDITVADFVETAVEGLVNRFEEADDLFEKTFRSVTLPIGLFTPFIRSEEHTSELQSLRHLVCRLL